MDHATPVYLPFCGGPGVRQCCICFPAGLTPATYEINQGCGTDSGPAKVTRCTCGRKFVHALPLASGTSMRQLAAGSSVAKRLPARIQRINSSAKLSLENADDPADCRTTIISKSRAYIKYAARVLRHDETRCPLSFERSSVELCTHRSNTVTVRNAAACRRYGSIRTSGILPCSSETHQYKCW